MTNSQESLMQSSLGEIDREYLYATKLHSLLEEYILNHTQTSERGGRSVDSIIVNSGWSMDIFDEELNENIKNRYFEQPITPISLAFWPDQNNPIYGLSYETDGYKKLITACPNGVLDHNLKSWFLDEVTSGNWLKSEEIKNLFDELQVILNA